MRTFDLQSDIRSKQRFFFFLRERVEKTKNFGVLRKRTYLFKIVIDYYKYKNNTNNQIIK